MKVLYLGTAGAGEWRFLLREEGDVMQWSGEVTPAFVRENGFEFLVSYGYGRILRKDVLDLLPGRAVNLHGSMLPWNRGAHPVIWSIVDGAPTGATLHHMDEGIDTGDVIAQRQVDLSEAATVGDAVSLVQREIFALLKENWEQARACRAPRRPQSGGRPARRRKDIERLAGVLEADPMRTPIRRLIEFGRRAG